MTILSAKWALGCVAAFGISLASASANIGGDGPPIPMTTAPSGSAADGYQAIEAGEYETATAIFLKIIQDEPTNAEAFNQLGYINRRLQDFPRAFAYYKKALDLDPQHTGAHHYIGEAYLEVGDLENAEAHLRQLDLLCLFGCDDFFELQQAVDLYKANHTG